MQERRNSIANALELRISCTNTSIDSPSPGVTMYDKESQDHVYTAVGEYLITVTAENILGNTTVKYIIQVQYTVIDCFSVTVVPQNVPYAGAPGKEDHWNRNVVILTNFVSLAAPDVVKMTTSIAASDKKNPDNDDIPVSMIERRKWTHTNSISVIIVARITNMD